MRNSKISFYTLYFAYWPLCFFLCTLAFVLFTYEGCSNPASPGSSFSLSVADVSCTEAWLNLHVNTTPASVTINKNGTTLFSLQLTTRDTTIYDSTLSPNQTYTYQATLGSTKSNAATAKTMDTTSHNFTWQLYTLGDPLSGEGSMLYDVSIVDENNIWVVGEIYLKDTVQMYNAAHGDGNKWNLLRVFYTDNSGNYIYTIRTLFSFSNNNVWFGNFTHWNGNEFISVPLNISFPYTINKIYGTSDNNLYIIGTSGNIARYNGSSWSKIESGTTLDLFDAYSTDGKDIYIAGGNFQTYDGIILKGNAGGFQVLNEGKNLTADQLFRPYFTGLANTVWVSDKGTVYFGGNLLYRYKLGQYSLVKSLAGNFIGGNASGQFWGFISKVRGNADNDIIMVGEGNTIRHFNGVTWQQLGMPYNYNSEYTWTSVNMKNNLIVAAGYTNSKAVIMVLKRQ